MILEAAAQVFDREGLDATTNRIAERAGVSVGSLYQYFPNKQAVLYGLAEWHLEHLTERLEGFFAGLTDAAASWPDTARAVIRTVLAGHAEHPSTHTLLYEYTPRTPDGADRLRRLLDRAAELLAAQLRRFRVGGPDHQLTAALLVHGLDAQVHRVVLAADDQDHAAETLLALWSALPVERLES
ncbi:TetR family transcriptional regulator [Tamaricihabitans halophyticus]|uniref:TetR family transcriptional regulator n=1 Tax=Tamaricihabitans halophyticus TaxID=1262583 RepID=A0A4R2QIS4_9PSEU|nr:TetR/AcrR family transcriptional regulator [Tamaricihabitans halophyticus]TCP49263.1 TetR family transcriptional regulator [Tamaricihabitans halophyticus]